MSPQFHCCIYDDAFDTCKRDVHFTSLWQRKAQLHRDEKGNKFTTVLSTKWFEKDQTIPISLPLPNVPQFVTQWDSQPTVGELTDDLTTPGSPEPLAPVEMDHPSESVEHELHPTTGIENLRTRSGLRITPNRKYFNDQMAHANSAYLETFSPTQDTNIQDLEILQANHFEEPHAFAFVYALVGSTGPNTSTFAEAMRAEDREDFIKAIHAQRTRRSHRKETLDGCAD